MVPMVSNSTDVAASRIFIGVSISTMVTQAKDAVSGLSTGITLSSFSRAGTGPHTGVPFEEK